jgi:hypothetical protein
MAGAARGWADPFASFGQLVSPPAQVPMVIGLLAALAVSGTAIVVRSARSAREERLQLKWFAAAAVLVVATFTALIWTNSDSVAAAILNNLALLCLDIAIAVAVLKYRLYEIDRIISRTLAYAIVTGLLIGGVRGPGAAGHRGAHSQVAGCRGRVYAGGRGPVQPAAVAGAAGGGPQVQPGPL